MNKVYKILYIKASKNSMGLADLLIGVSIPLIALQTQIKVP